MATKFVNQLVVSVFFFVRGSLHVIEELDACHDETTDNLHWTRNRPNKVNINIGRFQWLHLLGFFIKFLDHFQHLAHLQTAAEFYTF
jgi:hypothetical protein